jgi:predicted RNase H-like nuclease (RuvC/YqgF family)
VTGYLIVLIISQRFRDLKMEVKHLHREVKELKKEVKELKKEVEKEKEKAEKDKKQMRKSMIQWQVVTSLIKGTISLRVQVYMLINFAKGLHKKIWSILAVADRERVTNLGIGDSMLSFFDDSEIN